jgi:hypothetical protein
MNEWMNNIRKLDCVEYSLQTGTSALTSLVTDFSVSFPLLISMCHIVMISHAFSLYNSDSHTVYSPADLQPYSPVSVERDLRPGVWRLYKGDTRHFGPNHVLLTAVTEVEQRPDQKAVINLKWVLCVPYVSGSNLGPKTGHPDRFVLSSSR